MNSVSTSCFPDLDLPALLEREYHFRVISLERLDRGHTNASFELEVGDGRGLIVRQSWRGKPSSQVAREEAVLGFLRRNGARVAVPRLIPTSSGELHATVPGKGGGVMVHVFEKLPGRVVYSWHDSAALERSRKRTETLMVALAELHALLARFSVPGGEDPLARLEERLAVLEQVGDGGLFTIQGRRETRLPLGAFTESGHAILAEARSLPWEHCALQYCHGDFQLENVLFEGDRVSGVVDFDSLMFSARELDLAFALFSISRAWDDRSFRWSRELWWSCLRHYLEAARDASLSASPWLVNERHLPLLEQLFCLDQALLHLDCARRGIWKLERGIGFLPCFHRVLSAEAQAYAPGGE